MFLKTRKINLERELKVFSYPSFLLTVLSVRSTHENYIIVIVLHHHHRREPGTVKHSASSLTSKVNFALTTFPRAFYPSSAFRLTLQGNVHNLMQHKAYNGLYSL